jgi:hypothetical protein
MSIDAYIYVMREKLGKVMTGFLDPGSLPIAGQLMHEEFFNHRFTQPDPTKP